MAKKDFSAYFDQYGFLNHFHENGGFDAGDAAARTFTYWIEKYSSDPDHRYENAIYINGLMDLIEKPSGEYVRSPLPGWWNELGTMSRDQLAPLICCLVLYGPYCEALRRRAGRLRWDLLKRGLFCWNYYAIGQSGGKKKMPDWLGPSLFNLLFIRSNSLVAWFFPISWIIDLFFILNSMALVLTAYYDAEETGIDLNFQNVCYTNGQFFAPFNWLAKLIYVSLRPQPALPGQPREFVSHPSINVWLCYFYRDQDPPLGYVMRGWVEKNFT